MMTDRELLEFAAKAAGIVVVRRRLDDPMHSDMLISPSVRNPYQHSGPWNPLTDDGDALRLAVKLKINIEFLWTMGKKEGGVNCWPSGRGDCGASEDGLHSIEVTRKAITRAAAEIGKALQ